MARWLKSDGVALIRHNIFMGITRGHLREWSRGSLSDYPRPAEERPLGAPARRPLFARHIPQPVHSGKITGACSVATSRFRRERDASEPGAESSSRRYSPVSSLGPRRRAFQQPDPLRPSAPLGGCALTRFFSTSPHLDFRDPGLTVTEGRATAISPRVGSFRPLSGGGPGGGAGRPTAVRS
jgi:hypothetical protein